MEKRSKNNFRPCFLHTGVGSLPHKEVEKACAFIFNTLPQTPFWPQLPHHSLLESMNIQISPGLPFLQVEETKGEVRFDSSRDVAQELEKIYHSYISENIDAYALPAHYAAGFEGMIRFLRDHHSGSLQFFKGQMVGPITFGLAIRDGQGKNVIHNEVVFDALVKGLLLRGRWMIHRMKTICENIILSIDEPGLSGYGSAFFNVDGPTISRRLNEVIEEFQDEGAWVGIHCCGNTDWGLLMDTKVDIINFDAWGFLDRLSLYPESLENFLSRGGVLAWGIVPTADFTDQITIEKLIEKLEAGLHSLAGRKIQEEILRERCLLTPSCGMGLMPVRDAERAMKLLGELSLRMRKKYF